MNRIRETLSDIFQDHPSKISKLLKTTVTPGAWGNPNYVETYYNSIGYKYPCRTCGGKATYQLALSDHLFQPQGSLYYCDKDCPPNWNIISD